MVDTVSQDLFAQAQRRLPGGVNSPVRAFGAVGGSPIFIDHARGPYLVGADQRRYVDYVSSWGPMIFGHAHPDVVQSVQQAAERGLSFGAPTAAETELAELVHAFFPSMAMLRLVSSGTEAVMGALRAARGYTGRDLVIKFEGNYHGGADYLLVKAGSGAATFGVPTSAGVPEAIASTTVVRRYNDLDDVETYLRASGDRVAAVIVEPVAGNMGCVPPAPGFLEGLRRLTTEVGALLVFDEVMCGFRVAAGGAQERYGVRPDLTCLGKIIGGGMPMGAYGGAADIMRCVSPVGPVYQAGTLSGNPISVAAGLATVRRLRAEPPFEQLEAAGARLSQALSRAAERKGVPLCVQRVGSMITPFFREDPVANWDDASQCDTERFGRWHANLLDAGVHWPPSQFEAGFISAAHDEEALSQTEEAIDKAFARL